MKNKILELSSFDWIHSSSPFPVEECNIQNKREPLVFDSNNRFICLIVDDRFDDQAQLRILHPYIYKDGNETLFGWIDLYGNIYSNHNNSIHDDYEKVVNWIKI